MEWISIFRIIYFLGGVNSLFFSILIFSKKNKTRSDKILGSWLIILSVQLFYPFFYLSDLPHFQMYMGYESTLSAIHPVMLYFYTLTVTNQYKKSIKNLIIVLPVVLFILYIPFTLNLLPENRIGMIEEFDFSQMFNPGGIIIFFAIYGIMGYILYFFLYKSYKALKKYKIDVLQIYSYRENIDLLWLRRLILFFCCSYLLTVIISFVFYFTHISIVFTDFTFYLMLVIFVFLLAYWGYQQGNIFQFENQNEMMHGNEDHIRININEPIKREDFSIEAKELEKIVKENKPYLNPTLTIHDLAQTMNLPPHRLSKIIHKEFGTNFFEFINKYRIEHFKNSIKSKQFKDYTLLGIALECGFNSKSAFNRIFKEYTGMTPGDFKKAQSI